MPRSYRFEHFKASANHSATAGEHTAEPELKHPEQAARSHDPRAVHYGHKFAETERLFHERAEHPHTAKAKKVSRSRAETAQAPRVEARAEPREAEPAASTSAANAATPWDEARRHAEHGLDLLRRGAAEMAEGARELVGIPLSLVQRSYQQLWNLKPA